MTTINPLIFIVALVVAVMVWVLTASLKAGQFSYKSGGSKGGVSTANVKKSENPRLFWTLAAIHLGIILYVASFVFELQ